jgi:hypothetical protein
LDTVTQALRILRDMGFINIDPVYDDDEFDERPRRTNPYAL